ncbi:O-antigen ligase, partial [Halorubrum sp. Ea1]|uniref:O-antigen ligase family protein n=1 Tax=Halorubrum sp. Ea1 TaxID=1480718 RepID=UPI001C3E2B29
TTNFLRGKYSIPIWRRSGNVSIVLYLITITLFPVIGYVIYANSIGVLTSPIRKLQFFLFLPVTASLIYENEISTQHIYSTFLLIATLHITVGIIRFFNIDVALLAIRYESLITASTIDDVPARSAGMFGAIPWFGSLMAMIFIYAAVGLYNSEISIRLVVPLLMLSFLGIIMAISRTAMIMILPGIAVLVWYSAQQDGRLVVLGGTASAGFLIINQITGGGTLKRFAQMKNLITGNPSEISALDTRFELWQSGIVVFREFAPFGTLVSHSYVIDLVTDSLYISKLIQAGFVGVGTTLFLFGSIIACGFAETIEKGSLFSGLLIMTVTIGFAIGGITMNITGFVPAIIVFWITIGITIGEKKRAMRVIVRV